MASSFNNAVGGINCNDGSVCDGVVAEVKYNRKGGDTFRPLDPVTVEFVVELEFQYGESFSSIININEPVIDDLIARLQAAKEQITNAQLSSEVAEAFKENTREYRRYIITRAIANKRAELNQSSAYLNEILSTRTVNGKKLGVRKALDLSAMYLKEIDEFKATIAKMESALDTIATEMAASLD